MGDKEIELPSFNRTVVELKFGLLEVHKAGLTSFNRTVVELK